VREALTRVGQAEADTQEAVGLVRTQLGLIALQLDALGTHTAEWLRAGTPDAAAGPLAAQGGTGAP
jgi:hypothetical protein